MRVPTMTIISSNDSISDSVQYIPRNVQDFDLFWFRYNDVIMDTMASQITSLTIVYSTVYSDADQRKH